MKTFRLLAISAAVAASLSLVACGGKTDTDDTTDTTAVDTIGTTTTPIDTAAPVTAPVDTTAPATTDTTAPADTAK